MQLFQTKGDHETSEQRYFYRIAWIAQFIWAALFIGVLVVQHHQSEQEVLALAQQSATLSFTHNDNVRRWNLHTNGVYLPTEKEGPQQIITRDGMRLQRTVPAQMLSQMQEYSSDDSVQSKITSLAPINSANIPDPWERQLLETKQQSPVSQIVTDDGQAYYRSFHPIPSTDQCLSCHDNAHTTNGSIDGALSIRVALKPLRMMLRTKVIATTVSLFSLWFLGGIGIATTTRSLIKRIQSRDKALLKMVHSKNLYSALSATNQSIAKQTSQEQLFQDVCDIATTFAGFKLAWVGLVDKESKQVQPVARAGSMDDYIDEINVSIDPDKPDGKGPTSIAIRENRPVVISNFLQELRGTLWYEPAQRNGIRSSAAYPICADGIAIGALKVYADQTDFFNDELNELMQQMAKDLSLAIDHFEQQSQLERSQTLNQTLIDALPYPALLARYSDQRVITANRKALEMGIVIGEINHCCQLPEQQSGDQIKVKEKQREDGRWDMICWCPVDESNDGDIYLHFAVDITDRKKQESHVIDMAHHDTLTGLYNRRYLNNQLEQTLGQENPDPFTLILLDLNGFKQVNDQYGHLTGDKLLIQVSRRLSGVLRNCDTLSRWGGDEFVIMIPNRLLTLNHNLVQRIIHVFDQPFQFEHGLITSSTSIGLATYPGDGNTAEALLKAADNNMYQDKLSTNKD